jgi:hypothetical protein
MKSHTAKQKYKNLQEKIILLFEQLSIFQELELAGLSLGELLLEKANQGAQKN